MIGPSCSTSDGGTRSRASGAICLDAPFWCLYERALALSELKLFPIEQRRIARERDPTCRNGIG